MNDLHIKIKEKSANLGFYSCGFAKVEELNSDTEQLKLWIEQGMSANMSYMHNYIDKRENPALIVNGAQSIIVVIANYYHVQKQNPSQPQIASYAYSNDYHYIIKSKLKEIVNIIELNHPDSNNLICCDTAPILERAWAVRAGLGWIGRSSMLINPEIGNNTFIGCIVTSVAFPYDRPIASLCGDCTACIDNCPTGAIKDNKIIDARRCISYHTIENRSKTPSELEDLFGNRLYGCEECIKSCPWNKKADQKQMKELCSNNIIYDINWEQFSRSVFNQHFKYSAMQRAGYTKIKQRLNTILSKKYSDSQK